MTKRTHVTQKKNAVLAALLLLPALLVTFLWFSVALRYGDLTRRAKIDYFLDYFGGGIENAKIIFLVSIVFCVAALTFASRGFKKNLLSLRITMLVISLLSIFILLLDIYQVLQQ
jgi:hypothetical protein